MKFRVILLTFLIGLSLISCGQQEGDAPVTILVTQGFDETFFKDLAEDVRNEYGIDIEFVYEIAANQSSLVIQDFINNDMKADIVFTNSKVSNKYLQNCCLDFVSYSALTGRYPFNKMAENMTDDGCVYELPMSSRVVGITYNETLLKEMGCLPPKTFQDMLNLKKRCDEEGILFAVTDLRYTGCSFNYLFNLMGAQWLSTVKGTVWLEGFMQGSKTMTVFKEKARYFEKWVENGLFGEYVSGTSNSKQVFSQRRALFLFTSINTSDGYEGPQLDENGIRTGVMLKDVHRTMPWISEDGSNNCFTLYDNCWVTVNRSLAAKGKEKQLEKVLTVLNCLMSEKYTKKCLDTAKDIYISFDDYTIDKDRLYYNYAGNVKSGFLQPWYYNYFDESTIMATGAELGSYMLNAGLQIDSHASWPQDFNYDYNPNATFDTSISMLKNSLHSQTEDYLGWAEERVDAQQIARLVAISGAMSLQEQLPSQEVTVALLPYTNNLKELQPWRPVAVQNATAFPGVLQKSYSTIFEPASCIEVVGIRMTGAQIKELAANKYDPSGYFIDKKTGESTFDKEHYGPYPYALEVKGGQTLQDDKEYIVAAAPQALNADVYRSFERQRKLVRNRGGIVTANISHGIQLYFTQNPTINNSNISWPE